MGIARVPDRSTARDRLEFLSVTRATRAMVTAQRYSSIPASFTYNAIAV